MYSVLICCQKKFEIKKETQFANYRCSRFIFVMLHLMNNTIFGIIQIN